MIYTGQHMALTHSGGRGSARSARDWQASVAYCWGSVRDGKDDIRLARITKAGYKITHRLVLPATNTEPEIVVPVGTVLTN